MKLVLVTAVEAFHNEIIQLFKEASIENFSESDIDGYKNKTAVLVASDWFSGVKDRTNSTLFFSFTEANKIDNLFRLIKKFNNNLEINSPIRAIVVPIEKHI
ncbi:MAG: hypothetical protein HWD85_10605 [Flavobacteriaceae bacterium]|nr:hypothetical protein [Flavobacteriaceae bacterium]